MAKARSKIPKNPKVPLGVQQNLISTNTKLKSVLEYICSESNKLHNCATYYARQIWFKSHKYVRSFDIVKNLTKNVHFSALPSDAATQTCISVGESISSFGKLRELWLIRDAVNKAARLVIKHCLDNGIGTLVFGWNKGQKPGIDLGKRTNQNFVQIPTARLKTRIQQLCELYGMRFEETEESYTSKASFLDADTLPVYGEKPVGWKGSGKRVKRGLYCTSQGVEINADCNGSANILRKVSVKLGLNLSGISSGDLKAPLKFRIWTFQESQSLQR